VADYRHSFPTRRSSDLRMTTVLLDGRLGFVGVSGEFFCGHALQLKRRARLEHLFFLGYCNDYQQYFPTIEAAAEGGYGADAPVRSEEHTSELQSHLNLV